MYDVIFSYNVGYDVTLFLISEFHSSVLYTSVLAVVYFTLLCWQ